MVWEPYISWTQPQPRNDVFTTCHDFTFSLWSAKISESLYRYELSLKRKSWCLHFLSNQYTARNRLDFLYDLLIKSWGYIQLLLLGDLIQTRFLRALYNFGFLQVTILQPSWAAVSCSCHYWGRQRALHWAGSSDSAGDSQLSKGRKDLTCNEQNLPRKNRAPDVEKEGAIVSGL